MEAKGNKTKYEFAIVPVLNGTEGNYITNTVVSDFDGCYMCTKANQYHAFINLSLEVVTNQNKEFITTLGRMKPFAISNGLSSYDTISMSASFIPMKDCDFDFVDAARYRKEINKFLTEKQAIVLKDDRGSRWLVSVHNSIPQSQDGHPDNIVYNIDFTEVNILIFLFFFMESNIPNTTNACIIKAKTFASLYTRILPDSVTLEISSNSSLPIAKINASPK